MQDHIWRSMHSFFSHTYFPLVVLILVNLIVGASIVRDFGESWDEQPRLQYARKSIQTYLGGSQVVEDEKGSSYVMIAEFGSEILSRVIPNWSTIESWHFMNFLSFQFGLLFFYMICLKLTNKWGAFGATLLFSTQPLLWGHSFINPKDIPFMVFFLGSIALGLQMINSLPGDYLVNFNRAVLKDNGNVISRKLSMDWNILQRRKKIILVLIVGLSLLLLFGFFFADLIIRERIANLVYQAYNSKAPPLITIIFSQMAENMQSLPVENYVRKTLIWYGRFKFLFTIAIVGVNLFIIWSWFQSSVKWLWSKWIKPYIWLITKILTNKYVLFAAILLGLCSSVRTLGPASGLLVAGYWLIKKGRKAFLGLVVYFCIAGLVTYLAWPSLWGAPVSNFLSSFFQATDFGWNGSVLFQGLEINAKQLPASYLPVLLSLQFTLPALMMFVIGMSVTIFKLSKRQIDNGLVLLMAAWLFVPIIAVVVFRPTMYDNFRHFLFIIPPLFILASPGIGMLIEKSRNLSFSVIFLLILISPGIFWDIALHPYQYVYYNVFSGWTGGAFRKYEMDYWATSYREATLYLNEVTPEDSRIVVWGPVELAVRYGRLDLNFEEFEEGMDESAISADYAIVSTRQNEDEILFQDSPSIYQVGRNGAVFVVVKQLK